MARSFFAKLWGNSCASTHPRQIRRGLSRPAKIESLEVRVALAGDLSAAIVADIVPGAGGSDPRNLVAVNGTLFFTATDAVHGRELWKSDGTAAGTVLVKDILPGAGDSTAHELTRVGNALFLSASDGVNGEELWRSDGTAAGTFMVKNINANAGFGSNPSCLMDVNGTVYFSAADSVRYPKKNVSGGWPTPTNFELWKSDGTSAGTVLVKDIARGSSNSNPEGLINFNGTLYFRASDGRTGAELWKSNGTSSDTVIVKDIQPGPDTSWPDSLTQIGNRLVFTTQASSDMHGELWSTDGTDSGTVMLRSYPPASGPKDLTRMNGRVYFVGPASDGAALSVSDGSAAGTFIVRTFAQASIIGATSNLVFLSADASATGKELWASDGTAAGTALVKDIAPGVDGNSLPQGSAPRSGSNINGRFYFSADDGAHGRELWKSDGTAAGTLLVRDIYSGPESSNPDYLVGMNGVLYFAATDPDHGRELWDPPRVVQVEDIVFADFDDNLSDRFNAIAVGVDMPAHCHQKRQGARQRLIASS